MSPDPIILCDVSNIGYKSHFVMGQLSYEGKPTGMLHGFLRTVLSLQKLSSRLVFCWDANLPDQRPQPGWRKAIYPDYKSKRQPSKDREIVAAQLPALYKVLRVLGYPCVGIPGLEADDIMGLLSARKRENFLLFSSDDDLYQLLEADRVRVLHRQGEWKIITQADVEAEFGFPVKRWPTYLALGGDKSDDIRPLPGCGAKTAQALVLAGADPQAKFAEQPWRVGMERYEQAWKSGIVRHAYQVAHIPRTTHDWRITKLCVKYRLPKFLDRNIGSVSTAMNLFVQFCSQYGLMDAIADRYRFFESKRKPDGEQGRNSQTGAAASGNRLSGSAALLAKPTRTVQGQLRT